MILNVWSISSLFLAGAGAGLALIALVVGVRGWPGVRRAGRAGALDALSDRGHLLLLVVVVLAGVRFLAWPHFYGLLRSYVPDLALYGVMCAFGVTQIEPGLVGSLQWAKPLLLLVLGAWILTAVVDRRAGGPALLGVRVVAAVPIALLALAESGAEIVYVFREKVGRPVTCCTTFRESASGDLAGNVSPLAAWSDASPAVVFTILFALGALVVFGAVRLARGGPGPPRAARVLALAGLGSVNLVVTEWAWIDAVAPRVLALPYHHCIYELVTDIPALSVAALLAVIGNGCLWWPVVLLPFRRRASGAIVTVQRDVYAGSAVAVASALLIVAVHVA